MIRYALHALVGLAVVLALRALADRLEYIGRRVTRLENRNDPALNRYRT